MTIKYRPEIDGLRTIAILPVLFFHAGVGFFSGGYVGVDVFFVISGYLITSVISNQIAQGNFTLVNFYERRIRRIFPALFAVLLSTDIAALFLLLPSELKFLPSATLSTLFFVSNIYFFRFSGYFDTATEESPLLHTWSLGVEEQFYLFIPLILIGMRKTSRAATGKVFLFATLASLASCIFVTERFPIAAFFLLPMRAWELLTGSLLALSVVPKIASARLRFVGSAAGLSVLAISICSFTPKTDFPGFMALLPVVGTALIIHLSEGSPVARLLSLKPIVFIGLISYSLYVWHWPILVFSKSYGLMNSGLDTALVILFCIVCASLSWKYVEQPFRSMRGFARAKIFRHAATAGALLILLAFGIHQLDGWPGRFDEATLALDEAQNDFSPKRQACHNLEPVEKSCVFGEGAATVAVWSDSHGIELSYALAETGKKAIVSITSSACPPVLDFQVKGKPGCLDRNRRIFRYLMSDTSIITVIMTAQYRAYLDDPLFVDKFSATVKELQAAKKVIIVGPSPEMGSNVPKYLAKGGRPDVIVPAADAANLQLERFFSTVEADGVRVFRPNDFFCNESHCNFMLNDRPILFDNNHLSMSAATTVALALNKLL